MPITLYILGPPGSGKSTAFRYIHTYVAQQYKGWQAFRINDYEILQELKKEDVEHKRFQSTEHEGFNVTNYKAFDEALLRVKERLQEHAISGGDELVVVEFARNDYHASLQHFDELLQDAYFLFLEADKELCYERLQARVTDPPTMDNHFVSDYILDEYYYGVGKKYAPLEVKRAHSIENHRFLVIENNSTLEEFLERVKQFVDAIMGRESG